MKRLLLIIIVSLVILGCTAEVKEEKSAGPSATETAATNQNEIQLPEPRLDSNTSIEQAIKQRRSIREYSGAALKLADLSQLLWAAQGITEDGKRAAPSAGATYPLELYIVAGNVDGLDAGTYHYIPETHSVKKVKDGDLRTELGAAAMGQLFIAEAPAAIVFTAVYERTTSRYGDKGERYVHMEAGHAAENVCLQAESLGIGTVTVGSFSESAVKLLLGIKEDPLYIMPVGYK